MIKDTIKDIVKTHKGIDIDLAPYKKAGEALFSAKTQKILTIFVAIFIVFACVYKFVLPDFIKPELVSKVIKSSVNEGYSLDVKNLKTDLSWDLGLVLDADEVTLLGAQKKILYSKKTNVKLPLFMLLLQKIDGFEFYSTYVDTFLERDSDGCFNIQKAFKTKNPTDKIKKFRVAVKDYNISFVDKKAPPIIFNGYNLDAGNLNLYRLKTFGTISFPDGCKTILNVNFISKQPLSKGEFVLKGEIVNLNFKKIEKYLKEFFPEVTKACGEVNGDIDIDAYGHEKLTNNLKISLNADNVYISTKKYPHFFEIADDAQIFAEGKYYHHKLDFKKLRVLSRDYNLDLIGKIKNIDKKVKKVDIKIKSKNSDVKKLMGLIPKTVEVKHDGVNKAIKHNIDAVVNCDLRVKGRTNSARYQGNINLKNFVVDGDSSKSKSKIDLSYKNRKITIKAEICDSQGGLVKSFGTTVLGKVPRLDFNVFSDKFLLGEFRKNMLAMADILEFDSGILPELHPAGYGKVNASIKGEGKKSCIDGYLQFLDSTVKHDKLAKPVYLKSACIKLQGRKFIFDNLEAFVDSNKLIVNGFTSLDRETDAVVSASNFSLPTSVFILQNSELFKKANKAFLKVDAASGTINFNFRLLSDKFSPEGSIKAKGRVQLLGDAIKFTDLSPIITNISGGILCDENHYIIQKLTGSVLGSPIQVEGEVKHNLIDVKINAPNVDFAQTVPAILASKASYKIAPVFSKIRTPSGKFAAILWLKGDVSSDFFDKIECSNLNLKFSWEKFFAPIIVTSGGFNATKNELDVNKIIFNVLNAKGIAGGKITELSQIPKYSLNLDISNIDKTSFEALKKCQFSPQISKILNSLGEFSGNASGKIKISKNISGKIIFNNIGLKYLPASLPLKIKNGELLIENGNFTLPNSQIQAGNSKFKTAINFRQSKGLSFDLAGNLTPEDLDKYLNKVLLYPVNLKQSAPIKLRLENNKSSGFEIIFATILKPGNAVSYKGISIGDEENTYVAGGGFSSFNDIVRFNNLGICQYPNEILAGFGFNNALFPKNFMQISGWINQKSLEENLKVYSRDFININLLNEFMSKKVSCKIFQSGFFKGDVELKGRVDAPKLLGQAEFRNVKIPVFKIDIPSLQMVFTDDLIYLKNGLVKIADSELNVEGAVENVIELPYVFKNIKISSDYIDIDQIIKIFSKEGVSKESSPLLTVQNGVLSAKKLIIGNLATDDVLVDFTFTPDWIISLDKFLFSTAGGQVSGNSTFDFSSYESKTYMKFNNLKANAVSTTLLQMPNEIYGILNGEAKFSTRGITRTDLVKNSNGNLKFQIISGRLVRLGSLEYLLMAAEVVKSGITGLCLNNICTLLAPYKTGNFDTINVDFKVKNGVLFTDYLVSRSKNLSVYLAGSFDMTTNYSDFTILGRVSKSVINVLGPVGDFSINKVLSVIPGKDSTDSSLLSGLSKFPGVDFNDKIYRRFIVNIEGDLYDQKSVKNFRWLD